MTSKNYAPQSQGKGDAAHAIVRSGLGAIPFAGTASVELFSAIVTPPLVKRQREWMERVGNSLSNLEKFLDVDLESLQSDDKFLDIVLQSSHIALRTSQESKIEALKNTILNSALDLSLDESIKYMFLGCLDSFTSWHIKLLTYLDSPYAPQNKSYDIATFEFIEHDFPELVGRQDFYDLLGKDLYSRALINNANFKSPPDGGLSRSQSTSLGKEFLKFIGSPNEGGGA